MNVEEFYNKSEYSKIDFGSNPTLFTKKELLDFANEYLEAITVTRCSEQLKDRKALTFDEYVNKFYTKTPEEYYVSKVLKDYEINANDLQIAYTEYCLNF